MLNDLYNKAMDKFIGIRRKEILKELGTLNKEMRIVDLSEKFGMSMPLIIFHVNFLVKYGLVERKHKGSGVVIGVEITNKGRKLIEYIDL